MVRNFDSYANAGGFESGLRHGEYGTLGKSPHPVVLCPVSPMSEEAGSVRDGSTFYCSGRKFVFSAICYAK